MTRTRTALVLAGLLVLFAARLVHVSFEKSFTLDEPHYVATGLYLWKTGDYEWFHSLRLHPPLAFHLASLPLLALDLRGLGVHREAGVVLAASPTAPPLRIRVASRLPFVLLSCWGALLAFLWAREVAGDAAGLLAAGLFTFSPTLAAYGPLAHSDGLIAVFYLQTLYTFWRWWRAPSAARVALCGLSFGLALAAKASAVLLPVMMAGILAVLLARPGADAPPLRARLSHTALALAGIGAIGLAVLWLSYGGSFRLQPERIGPFDAFPFPDYLRSLLMDRTINDADHYFWFFGKNMEHAPRWILPAAFALKTPIPILLLGVAAALRRGGRAFAAARLGPFLGIPAALYAAVVLFVIKLPYGLRYILPLHPLLFVFVATRLGDVSGRRPRAAIAACLVWLALASAWIHPHYLAYFNELIGGPRRAHAYFADSNLDWGQDLPALAHWLAAHGNPPVRAALVARERPRAYGIRALPLEGCEAPASGLVAISVSTLRGVTAPDLFGRPPPGCYAWLRDREPVAMPGYSILVFDLDAP